MVHVELHLCDDPSEARARNRPNTPASFIHLRAWSGRSRAVSTSRNALASGLSRTRYRPAGHRASPTASHWDGFRSSGPPARTVRPAARDYPPANDHWYRQLPRSIMKPLRCLGRRFSVGSANRRPGAELLVKLGENRPVRSPTALAFRNCRSADGGFARPVCVSHRRQSGAAARTPAALRPAR